MKTLFYKINRWFELNLGWILINGRKQEKWREHLKEKYGEGTKY